MANDEQFLGEITTEEDDLLNRAPVDVTLEEVTDSSSEPTDNIQDFPVLYAEVFPGNLLQIVCCEKSDPDFTPDNVEKFLRFVTDLLPIRHHGMNAGLEKVIIEKLVYHRAAGRNHDYKSHMRAIEV